MLFTGRLLLDGANITVWWGALGGSFNEVLSTSSATELTTTTAAHFRAAANTEHGWDNVTLIAGTRSTTQTFTHNGANEQITSAVNGVTTTMTYDEWGRLTERDDTTHTATYTYRYGSKLYSVASDFPGEGSVTYETGGDRKRRSTVAGVNESWYNYTIGFDVVSTENDADGSTGALTMTNVLESPVAAISWTRADLASSTPSGGTARYYSADRTENTRSVWNASKVIIGQYEYTPYVDDYSTFGPALSNIGRSYAGRQWDGDAALILFAYRQYSPQFSRWTTRDPLGMLDGPNTYSYVASSPVTYYDLLGLFLSRVVTECTPAERISVTAQATAQHCPCGSRAIIDDCKRVTIIGSIFGIPFRVGHIQASHNCVGPDWRHDDELDDVLERMRYPTDDMGNIIT